MLVLPIPLVTSLALGFLFLHALLRGDRPWLYSALIAASALQGVVISLAQHYDVAPLRFVQPVTATLVPPLAWVTFQATAVRAFDSARDLPHLAVPAFTAFCVAFAPATLDLVVPAVFLIYGAAIFQALRAGADGLPQVRLETGDRPGLIWGVIAFALIISAAGDGLIALAHLTGAGWLQPWIVSLSSSLSLGLVGALVLSQSLATGDKADAPPTPAPNPADVQRDADIMARLEAFLVEEALYTNAGLTLERLSRRLRVPAKQLSATINRVTGGNVSRYVNAFRIQHACERLKAGDNVTTAMLSSGFNTKSNFNREFLRLKDARRALGWRRKARDATERDDALVQKSDARAAANDGLVRLDPCQSRQAALDPIRPSRSGDRTSARLHSPAAPLLSVDGRFSAQPHIQASRFKSLVNSAKLLGANGV